MTMKKILTSSVAALAISTSAYAAGTLTVQGGVMTASTELLAVSEIAEANVTNQLTYLNGMSNGSASEPTFELKFPTGVVPSAEANLSVLSSEDNSTIATFDRIDGSSVLFTTTPSATVERGKTYKIVSADTNETITNGDLRLQIPKGTTAVTGTLILGSNSGDSILDTATDTVIENKQQFAMAVATKLDAQIDASGGFLDFYTSGANVVADTVSYSLQNDMNITFPATITSMTLNLVADQNLSKYAVTVAGNPDGETVGDGGSVVHKANITSTRSGDSNVTYTTTATGDMNLVIDSTLTTDKSDAMAVTNFKSTGVVVYNGVTKTLLDNADTGSWTIYGYTAQIPNVAGLSTHDTTMKFTNRSKLDVEIYFTLIDPDGTVVTLNSIDTTLASLPANSTGRYKASDLVALINDAEFNASGSFSVEVSIPTTPSSVYGMASFKNIDLGQFKDLPVYNSSSMSY